MREYEYAAQVWHATWRNNLLEGQLKDVAVNQYGVLKRGWLKEVWQVDFLQAIWRQARNHFEVAEQALNAGSPRAQAASDATRNPLLGSWNLTMSGPDGRPAQMALTVKGDQTGYQVTLRSTMGNISTRQITRSGNAFTIYVRAEGKKQVLTILFDGVIEGDSMRGSLTYGDSKNKSTGQFSGSRVS